MSKYLSGNFCFQTDRGKVRLNNEDQAYAAINAYGNVLLLICDGMGGANKGEFASSLAKNIIVESFLEKKKFFNKTFAHSWVHSVLKKANSMIYNEASTNANCHDMGSTITLALIIKDTLILGQMGDSRCYLLKNNHLEQISDDQTYVGYLYRTGQIKKEEMLTHPKRHILMNAAGVNALPNIEVKYFPYKREKILLCSDGLYNNVSENDLECIIRGQDSINKKVTQLINLANANGGSDNIGVVLWEADEECL